MAMTVREAEALTGLKELRQQVRDLEDHWQVGTELFPPTPKKGYVALFCLRW